MYSPRVIEHSIASLHDKGIKGLKRHEVEYCQAMTARLENAKDSKTGKMTRELTAEEKSFVFNEHFMTMVDARYFCERYATVKLDGTYGIGYGIPKWTEAQLILFDLISKLQGDQWERAQKGEAVDGILICDHKARQVFHTALMRMLQMHRACRLSGHACVAVSVDEEKRRELWTRDQDLYNRIPWWIKPTVLTVDQENYIKFGTESTVEYFQNNKQSSMGQSKQFNFGHLTELSEYPYPDRIQLDLFPGFPYSYNTLVVLESRANFRSGWWYEFSEKARHGKMRRWNYCFIPWYAEAHKYRLTPTSDWTPAEHTQKMAAKVRGESISFMGRTVDLTLEQMYWWETVRDEHIQNQQLHIFLTGYPSTPEESFQHPGKSVFPVESLDAWRNECGSTDPRVFAGKGGVPFAAEAA